MMERINEILITSFASSLPTIIIVFIAFYFLKSYLDKYLMFKINYKDDKFRLETEDKITNLNNSIVSNKERFTSVNHLILEGSKYASDNFLKSLGINERIKVKPNSAFVLTPFNPSHNDDYEWIKSFFVDHGYKCQRGDDVMAQSIILSHIIKEMLSSEIVVANVSGRNPNVFYELGIAHAFGKKVILVSRSKNDISFDISNVQVVIYKDKETLYRSLSKWLVSILNNNEVNSLESAIN